MQKNDKQKGVDKCHMMRALLSEYKHDTEMGEKQVKKNMENLTAIHNTFTTN